MGARGSGRGLYRRARAHTPAVVHTASAPMGAGSSADLGARVGCRSFIATGRRSCSRGRPASTQGRSGELARAVRPLAGGHARRAQRYEGLTPTTHAKGRPGGSCEWERMFELGSNLCVSCAVRPSGGAAITLREPMFSGSRSGKSLGEAGGPS
jgi:hypothetical protein